LRNDNNENSIEFEHYEVFLYSRNGTFICNTKIKNLWGNNNSEKDLNDNDNDIDKFSESCDNGNNEKKNTDMIMTKLIKNICLSDFKKNNQNNGIHYNNLSLGELKISFINIPVTNLIAVGVFSKDTKSSIIRLFLLNMIVSFLNYIGDKNDYFKSQQYKEINSINKMNKLNFSNFLQSKIYDSFLSIPIQVHFSKTIQKVFKKRALYIKDIYYKNYYLVDLNTNKTIFTLDSIHKNKDIEQELKITNQEKLWGELLFHCQNLKKDYIKKNNMTFSGLDYQNFFVKIEYLTTYPRRTFIIKFLPLFNGMCIIHEYIQLKISTFEGDEKKEYKEKKIIYGYDSYDNIFRNTKNSYFENEHPVLKQVHFFLIESLFCSNSSLSFFFILTKIQKIYFSEEILEIIKTQIAQYMENEKNFSSKLKFNHDYCSKKIIQKIINVLYDDYIQINSGEKILHKSSSALPLKAIKGDILNFKSINSGKVSHNLQITKNDALIYLFNTIKFNKNINPNDITIDLNDEKKNKDNEIDDDLAPIPRTSDLIGVGDRFSKPSLRFSDLLSEKISTHPTHQKQKTGGYEENPFPLDSEDNDYKDTAENLKVDIKKEYEEMSIGTKIKKKYKNNDNYKLINKNNSIKKFSNNHLNKNKYGGETSLQKSLYDGIEKYNIENSVQSKGDNKPLNSQYIM